MRISTNKIKHTATLNKVESSTLFNDILNSITDNFFSLDCEYRYTSFNKSHASVMNEIYGVKIEIGHKLSEYQLVLSDWELAKKNLDRALSGEHFTESAYSGEPGLKRLYFEISHSPIVDDTNKIIGVSVFSKDITEAKRIAEALKESEEKFRNIFENSVVGKSLTTTDGKMKVNKAFCDVLGYSEQELSHLKWQEFTFKEDIENDEKRINQILNGEKESARWEKRYIHKNGNIVWVDISSTIQRDLEGKPLYFITSIIDITDRKFALENLRQSEDRYRSLFQRNYSVMLILNPDNGNIIDANPAACEFYGWTYEEMCNKNITDINQLSKEEVKNILIKTKTEKQTHLFLNHRLANGEVRDVEVYSTPINYGSTILLYSIVHDITEQKLAEKKLRESEEKLSSFFSSMNEMVAIHELVFDNENKPLDYRIIDCNDAFTKITGIKKENAVGKLATEVYKTESAPYLTEYSNVGMTGEPYEFNSFFAPMDKHFLISVISPKKNQFATITNDITEIQRIQEQVVEKNKELENYLYIASHDLRSPLVNIQGFSQRFQNQASKIKDLLSVNQKFESIKSGIDKIAEEDMPKTLNFILSNVSKMDTLIKSLLQISRTGRLNLTVKEVNMNALLKKIIAAHNYQITELSAKVDIHELLNCYGDENQLNQLFSNIIDNALKYRDPNRLLKLEISSTENYNKVIYSISDTGKGINSRYLEKIWDVFYRADPESAESGEGIGLSISKTIANKHKGRIWAESEEGKGSTFFIELQKNEFSE
ncbi:MAG: PAS domain S-box protein [Paludibacter sp.]|nr:PAS domain S-box protein [Paludibacter sp.]